MKDLSYNFNPQFQSTSPSPFHKITCNFILRNKRCVSHTSILCVVYVEGKQYAFPIGAKVRPSMWDKKTQSVYVGSAASLLENQYNANTNNIISHFRLLFDKFRLYLCSVAYETSDIKAILTKHFNLRPMTKSVYKRRAMEKATDVLQRAFNLYYQRKNVKHSTIAQRQTTLNVFKHYAESKGVKNDLTLLTQRGYNDYKEYLAKRQLIVKTINGNLALIAMLINKVICVDNEFIHLGINPIVNVMIPPLKTISKKCEILDNEIEIIENVQLNDKEDLARNMFLLLTELGQRISDYPSIIEASKKGDEWVVIDTIKEGTKDTLHFTERVRELIARIPKDASMNDNAYRRCLRRIFAKAKLNRAVKWSEQRGYKIVEREGVLSDVISSHFARHTFITKASRKGLNVEAIARRSGHTSTDIITKVYLHQTDEDIINKAKADESDKANNTNGEVEELRNILTCLGADAVELLEAKDVEALSRLLYGVKESELLRKGVPLEAIKAIYNRGGSLSDRRKAIQALTE